MNPIVPFIFTLILFCSLVMNIDVACADLTVFNETIVYGLGKPQESQYAIGTISFAGNGTLFVNAEENVYKLVNGSVIGDTRYDIRPKNDSGAYYDLGSCYGIAVAPNGTLYVSVNNGSYGLIYKVVDGKVFWESYVYRRLGRINELAFRPDGELFYTDGESIYSITEGEVFSWNSIWKEKIVISSIAFSPDGTLFASARYNYPFYDIIVKRVDDVWRLIYVRPVRVDQWGIDNIAISPNGEIYLEDHDPFFGQLYKLVYKNQISLDNGSFYLGQAYPVISNSTISDYSYDVGAQSKGELKLNLTGIEGTWGVSIIPIFRCNYPDGLEVQIEANGSLLEFNITQSSVAYIVSFKYLHGNNSTLFKITLAGIVPHHPWLDILRSTEFPFVTVGIIFSIVVLVLVYRRKRHAQLSQTHAL